MSPPEAPHRSKLTSQIYRGAAQKGGSFSFSTNPHRTRSKEDPDIEGSQAGGLGHRPADVHAPIVKTVEPERSCSSTPICMSLASIATAYPTRTGEQHGGPMQPCPEEANLSALITTHGSAIMTDAAPAVHDLSHRAVAQLVEHRSPKPVVVGSSPSRPAQQHGTWVGGTAATAPRCKRDG